MTYAELMADYEAKLEKEFDKAMQDHVSSGYGLAGVRVYPEEGAVWFQLGNSVVSIERCGCSGGEMMIHRPYISNAQEARDTALCLHIASIFYNTLKDYVYNTEESDYE